MFHSNHLQISITNFSKIVIGWNLLPSWLCVVIFCVSLDDRTLNGNWASSTSVPQILHFDCFFMQPLYNCQPIKQNYTKLNKQKNAMPIGLGIAKMDASRFNVFHYQKILFRPKSRNMFSIWFRGLFSTRINSDSRTKIDRPVDCRWFKNFNSWIYQPKIIQKCLLPVRREQSEL